MGTDGREPTSTLVGKYCRGFSTKPTAERRAVRAHGPVGECGPARRSPIAPVRLAGPLVAWIRPSPVSGLCDYRHFPPARYEMVQQGLHLIIRLVDTVSSGRGLEPHVTRHSVCSHAGGDSDANEIPCKVLATRAKALTSAKPATPSTACSVISRAVDFLLRLSMTRVPRRLALDGAAWFTVLPSRSCVRASGLVAVRLLLPHWTTESDDVEWFT